MSDFVPYNRNLREVLIFLFHSKKTAADAHRELQKVCRDAAISETTCHDRLCRFKDGDFDIDDRPRKGHGLADQQFRSYEDIEEWLHSWIASKYEHFCRKDIRALPEKWAKVVANDGEYFE